MENIVDRHDKIGDLTKMLGFAVWAHFPVFYEIHQEVLINTLAKSWRVKIVFLWYSYRLPNKNSLTRGNP